MQNGGAHEWQKFHQSVKIKSLQCICFVILGEQEKVVESNKVDFLGMSVDKAAAVAGQWILLVLGLVLLVATILVAYKYKKAKKSRKSLSSMELK